jgi:hypothetical protein
MEKNFMMKQDRNFRLSKEIKRIMASIPKEKSSDYKRLMIQGVVSGSIEPPREKKKNKHKTTTSEPVAE